jgi:DNA-binding protein YbaB
MQLLISLGRGNKIPTMGISDAFGKLGDINKLRQQAMQMQKNLSGQAITVEENGVMVEISGDQRILKLEIQGMSNEVLNDVLNKAIRKSQELAAKELMNISGGQM